MQIFDCDVQCSQLREAGRPEFIGPRTIIRLSPGSRQSDVTRPVATFWVAKTLVFETIANRPAHGLEWTGRPRSTAHGQLQGAASRP